MFLKKSLVSVYLILFIILISFSQIKVACIGDSITFGFTILNRKEKSYPARLAQLLGKGWSVENFGVIGATLLKNGDIPYWKQKAFIGSKNFNPDVVIIMLGTNDTKPQNWKFKKEYISDYTAMINEFRALPSKPYIFICLPVPAYTKILGISDSIIKVDIIPMIKLLGKENNVPIIDLYQPLSNHTEWFTDKIHPNAAGAREMAKVIYNVLLQNKKKIEKRKS
jgi:lysophospholipase L1-like esterase